MKRQALAVPSLQSSLTRGMSDAGSVAHRMTSLCVAVYQGQKLYEDPHVCRTMQRPATEFELRRSNARAY
jgi:hypothetical protein